MKPTDQIETPRAVGSKDLLARIKLALGIFLFSSSCLIAVILLAVAMIVLPWWVYGLVVVTGLLAWSWWAAR